MLLNFCKVKLVQNFCRKAHIGGGRAHCAQKWGCIAQKCTQLHTVAHSCTQLHTGTKLHEIAQKHETKVHNTPGAPPSIQPHASALPPEKKRNKKRKLESLAFSTKLLTTKASSLPLINLLVSPPLRKTVLDRLRLMQTRRWKEPWLF